MEWKTVKLGEVITIKYGKDHKALGAGNVPVYGSGGIMRYADKAIYDKPSILIPRKGSLNNIFYVDKPFWTVDTMFWSIIDTEKADPHFLFYTICKLDFAGLNVGSAVPSLTVPVIEAVELPLPPLETQRRIAAILSSLDDKIENNNRINRNLEAQAQALFKSWFVDFEPWGGIMPEDWKEGTLGEICSFNKRKIGPKFANPIQYLDTGHLTEGVIEGYQRFNPGDKIPSSARRYVGEGDILFSLCRPNMRHYGLMMNPPENIVASTGFAVISANWSGYRYYIYQWLKQDGIIDNIHAVAEQSSTTYPTIDVDYLAGMTMIIPSIADTDRYALLCRDLYSKIESNYQENLRLATLRDTLLPKLMRGEITL